MFTYEERVGIRSVGQVLHVDAGEASLYLDHREDEVDDGAGVEQMVPRLVAEELDRTTAGGKKINERAGGGTKQATTEERKRT